LGLLALQDGAESVAGLGDLGQVEGGPGFGGGFGRGAAAIAAEVGANAFRLVFVDGAGVRFAGHTDGFERIEDGPALNFQFSCQIVDSNFVHPSLFVSLTPGA
jgi:hypothetical protein